MNLNIKVLAPNEQKDDRDFGDCIIINDNGNVTVYDCGSFEINESSFMIETKGSLNSNEIYYIKKQS